MCPHSAGHSPDSLDWIQLRTVGWQVQEREPPLRLFSPLLVKAGMMVPGVVDDDHDSPLRVRRDPPQILDEAEVSLSIKLIFFSNRHEFAVTQAYRSEVTDAVSGRVVKQNRVLVFRCHPHSATRTMLLKVDFIRGPQVNCGISSQELEFF
jgi:hypothetical protein